MEKLYWQMVNWRDLGNSITTEVDLDKEVSHVIHAGWTNWKRVSGVLCDRRIIPKIKGKNFKTVVRPDMFYGSGR